MLKVLRGWRGVLILGVVIVLVAAAVVVNHGLRTRSERTAPLLSVLSSRPDVVSGGSVMIAVASGSDGPADGLRVTVNGTDHTAQLHAGTAGLEGVVDHLVKGPNTIVAAAPGGIATTITVVNHPISGPVFAGPRPAHFRCEAQRFRSAAKVPLGPVLDKACTVADQVGYVYRTSTGSFRPLPSAAVTDPAQRPADLAEVTLADGAQVPFVVRIETSSIDRGVAQTAMLADLTAPGGLASHWNHKLIYTFGGSCGSGNRQGTRTVGILSPNLLTQGFAVASNSLNAMDQNCNDVIAAEAFAMTREHFIKTHGVPLYTMGLGCSGGAAQAYGIADNYPGLLDGVVAGCSVPDVASGVGQLAFDARLLDDFRRRHPGVLSDEAIRAVAGVGSLSRLAALSRTADVLDPTRNLAPEVPERDRYNARTNPRGERGSIWDQSPAVYGTVGKPPRALRPLDNVGVQYGLAAFASGDLTFDQFLTLNRLIGGLDTDLKPTAGRTIASRKATERAYSTGRILSGGAGLESVPVIDYRSVGYSRPGSAPTDDPTVALDLRIQSFALESRLVQQTGQASNLVLLTDSGRGRFDIETGVVAVAITQMDQWITTLESKGGRDQLDVAASKPAGLVDACYDRSGTQVPEEPTLTGPSRCNELYPVGSTPRMVAGGPVAANVISCTLKRIDPNDYKPSLSDNQRDRLAKVFPRGVCNWASPSVGFERLDKTWAAF